VWLTGVALEIYACSCMTKERVSNENIEELWEESSYIFSICDRAFSDRAEFEVYKNSIHMNSNRLELFL